MADPWYRRSTCIRLRHVPAVGLDTKRDQTAYVPAVEQPSTQRHLFLTLRRPRLAHNLRLAPNLATVIRCRVMANRRPVTVNRHPGTRIRTRTVSLLPLTPHR